MENKVGPIECGLCGKNAEWDQNKQRFVCVCGQQIKIPLCVECVNCKSRSVMWEEPKKQYYCHDCRKTFTLMEYTRTNKKCVMFLFPDDLIGKIKTNELFCSIANSLKPFLPTDTTVLFLSRKFEPITIDTLIGILLDMKIDTDEKLSTVFEIEKRLTRKIARMIVEISDMEKRIERMKNEFRDKIQT